MNNIINPRILPFTQLNQLPLKNAVGIEAKYRNAKVYPAATFGLLTPNNPLWPRHNRRWQTRTDPLWWSALARKDFEGHRVVRSWAARRIRASFTESLRKKGYATNGMPLPGSQQEIPLYGSLQLFTLKGSTPQVTIEQLAQETDKVVEEIIKRQGPVSLA